MDWKDRAAGEREDEVSLRSEKTNEEQEYLEYVASALVYLETFTRETLGEHETKLWIQRLCKYPRWKIEKLCDYSGKLSGVFDYLDRLNRIEDNYIRPKYETNNEIKECGAKLWRGIKEIVGNEEIENKKAAIADLHKKLREEYPRFVNFLKC